MSSASNDTSVNVSIIYRIRWKTVEINDQDLSVTVKYTLPRLYWPQPKLVFFLPFLLK